MKHRYLTNVVTLKLIREKCTGCGKCIEVCPHKVFELKAGKSELVDRDACMECGACARNCPFEAIEVKPGVGCASAILTGWLTGSEPTCGCPDTGDNSGSSGCC